jgi:hypothetical protein
MFEQFGDGVSIPRVLLEADEDEVLGLLRDRHGLGELDLVLDLDRRRQYDLHEVLLSHDFEGHSAEEQFVGEDAHAPHVDLVVVVLPLQQFRRNVQRRPAEGLPHGLRTDRPAEVADLYQSLPQCARTLWKMMFSGLRSRWMISHSCM